MSRCPGCGTEQVVFRIDNGDGTFQYLPVAGNIVTIPADPGETIFDANEGPGVSITPGGNNGHGPTIGVCIGDGLSVDAENCLIVETGDISPPWTTPNASQPIQGIVSYPGGTDGHAPAFAIAIHPDSDNVTFDGGQLLIQCCPDTPWQASASTSGIVITPGDNPNGDPGNGHRPSFGLAVDGATIGFNDDGELIALGGAVADLCPSLSSLPTVPAGVNVEHTIGLGDDGNCYRVDACIVYADAGGADWDENNANWIDPTTVAKWCELRLDNGLTGCEIWRNLDDVNGVLQWHQVA